MAQEISEKREEELAYLWKAEVLDVWNSILP